MLWGDSEAHQHHQAGWGTSWPSVALSGGRWRGRRVSKGWGRRFRTSSDLQLSLLTLCILKAEPEGSCHQQADLAFLSLTVQPDEGSKPSWPLSVRAGGKHEQGSDEGKPSPWAGFPSFPQIGHIPCDGGGTYIHAAQLPRHGLIARVPHARLTQACATHAGAQIPG